MSSDFFKERITVIKSQIVAYEDAITAFASHATQTYTIDTGQTRQTVTRADLSQMKTLLQSLYNQLATLEARVNGGGTTIARPGW